MVKDAPTPRVHCENQRGILVINLYKKLVKNIYSMLINVQQNVFFMSHMTRKHITLWLGCIVCEACSKASMTMKLHKEVDHKKSESITNFTSFFNRRNQLIREKMFPVLRITPIRRFLNHNPYTVCVILHEKQDSTTRNFTVQTLLFRSPSFKSTLSINQLAVPFMDFRRAGTELSQDFRKANKEPSVHFRWANTETYCKYNVNLSKRARMDGFFSQAGLAAPRDFPCALPSGNPSEQPCQPLENHVHHSSFTLINPTQTVPDWSVPRLS